MIKSFVMNFARLQIVLFLTGLVAGASAQGFQYPSAMPGAKAEVYKTIGDTKLNLYIYAAENSAAEKHPAIVFFFGGGWANGSPAQFEHQCRRLASLGMVAISADYRVSSRNHSTIDQCVRDAKSAIRYVRANASRLGIDPLRIAAAGGSAGGMLAASTALIPGLEEPAENARIDSRPNALVLFNPALILAPVQGDEAVARMLTGILARQEFKGIDPDSISPWHHVGKNEPPTIILHGREDTTVPYATMESFAQKMRANGNRCDLMGFAGQKHAFFNYSPKGNPYYDQTLTKAEEFLASLGYIKGRSTSPQPS